MKTLKLTLTGATLAGIVLLGGCGGGGGDSTGSTPAPAATPAETILGVELLPPDGGVASASALAGGELPPDASAAPGTEDLPPI